MHDSIHNFFLSLVFFAVRMPIFIHAINKVEIDEEKFKRFDKQLNLNCAITEIIIIIMFSFSLFRVYFAIFFFFLSIRMGECTLRCKLLGFKVFKNHIKTFRCSTGRGIARNSFERGMGGRRN